MEFLWQKEKEQQKDIQMLPEKNHIIRKFFNPNTRILDYPISKLFIWVLN